ncbi:hypothetical protein QN363_20840, partial [Undibacterium sp. CCC2.1]|uniref:hypothetical protein n=1 Tax=Undibacterium sp. CCC2.1 TaxID=3048604 RepID=UPI002B22C3C5
LSGGAGTASLNAAGAMMVAGGSVAGATGVTIVGVNGTEVDGAANSSGGLVTIGNAASNAPVTLGSTGTVTAQSVKINGA